MVQVSVLTLCFPAKFAALLVAYVTPFSSEFHMRKLYFVPWEMEFKSLAGPDNIKKEIAQKLWSNHFGRSVPNVCS